MVGRGCSVVTSVGLRGVDGVLFVESDPVRNDGVDAHRARGVSLFRPRQQQSSAFASSPVASSAKVTGMVFYLWRPACWLAPRLLLPRGFTSLNPVACIARSRGLEVMLARRRYA